MSNRNTMIRPLDYCETTTQIATSLETIDARIEELITLREVYRNKQRALAEQETINVLEHNNEQ
ncbi:hypothetical protein [Sphingobacterium psychroaquaticum]|uniref:Uncharacterized protein n=1 Tax=Sphingobacterium psychroaquaticum TaxID=561061 RepID=A0A1X7K2L4_9SPHI|nr:hypothetical protein [Sphingobacterium psychroaquaticum]QBQ42571.1 hypothetical protein E2P86_16060 [Sphingobacterium psychroaquaticum]SMG35040.1 hypothetical protein SAMN05660862_2466 [Sphingobacterium psychroaquaticum]